MSSYLRSFRFAARATVIGVLAAAVFHPVAALAVEPKVRVDIPAQDLSAALTQFGRETGVEIVFAPDAVREKKAAAVKGEFERDRALQLLLEGSGLTYRVTLQGAIVVEPSASRAGGPQQALELRMAQSERAPQPQNQTEAGRAGSSSAAPAADADNKNQEIIVSAQKRSERLQDVPVPVTAISAESLINSNQLRLQDYYTKVPGLGLTALRSSPVLIMRGVTTGLGANPTVSIIVDDVPYGSSTLNGGGLLAADLDPSDLARVEVLRGPQGTLYGASSLGGLLKFVTIDPSTEAFSGRVQAGVSDVNNGDGLGYSVRGAVNIPISETWALRATGFTRRDPGFIDDVRSGKDGINRVDVDGGRMSALWRPNQDVSLKLGALIQKVEAFGASQVYLQPGLRDLQQDVLPGTGWYDRRLKVYSATLSADLGPTELTAASGYSINTLVDALELGPGVAVPEDNETRRFTQEVRLTVPMGERVEWLFGGFYTRERSDYLQVVNLLDPATGAFITGIGSISFPTTYDEYAAFADLTFRVSDRFDVQIGGRQSWNKQTIVQTATGAYVATAYPELASKDNAFTYLLTPRFKITPEWMVYGRFTSGYRAGGPNGNLPSPSVPPQYDPDMTQNYEIGVKGEMLDRMLSLDAAVYYIDWKDIQLYLFDNVTSLYYNSNAGRAKSQGVELSMEARLPTGLSAVVSTSWNTAELTEDLPSTSLAYGLSGDRLPFSSRFSGSLILNQEFAVSSAVTAFVGGSVSYVGDRMGGFRGVTANVPDTRQVYPSYTKVDLLAGARFGDWTVNLFASNVTDKRGLLAGGLGSTFPQAFDIIQPRTVGMSVVKTF